MQLTVVLKSQGLIIKVEEIELDDTLQCLHGGI